MTFYVFVLQAMVDVSTAYCNCNQTNIEEKIYEAPGNPRGMVEMCQWMDPEIINSPEVTRKMIGDQPNTYTFTKVQVYYGSSGRILILCRRSPRVCWRPRALACPSPS